MDNAFNISPADMKQIEALTEEQLKAVRRNIKSPEYSDDETREALMHACADGHDVADFLA